MTAFHIAEVGDIHHPEAWLTGILRNFPYAAKVLGAAADTLELRLARSGHGLDPNYQIGTTDGADAAAFSGTTHELLYDDVTHHIDKGELAGPAYTAEHVRAWLDQASGAGDDDPMSPGMRGETGY
ncbi:hypothetical protein [Afifella sp. IM 167]|uniref:hypothetical protein n=1 Tax=Afifella sp. IM 167 TaxID=2033586 RepID=UPI001CCDA00D|nr:hypothetical protein [Afifella sp. IM 167]MBZ8131757.1 hypothetical protein [Afifella sp. IM 167]